MQFSTQSIPFIGKARRNKFGIGSGLLLILMGVVFIGASLLIMQKQIAARDWPTTTGQVSHVAERLDSEDGMRYTSTITYTVNGQEYKVSEQSSSSSRDTIGSPREVRYNPTNPGDGVVSFSGFEFTFFLFPIIGVGLIFVAIFGTIRSYKRSATIKQLKQSGQKIQGVVTHVDNGTQRGSVIATVSAQDSSGQMRTYRSDSITGNTFTLLNYQTQPIAMDVYIDATNPERYYVDIDDVPELSADSLKALLQQATSKQPFGNSPTTATVEPNPPQPATPAPLSTNPVVPPVGSDSTTVPPAQNYQ